MLQLTLNQDNWGNLQFSFRDLTPPPNGWKGLELGVGYPQLQPLPFIPKSIDREVIMIPLQGIDLSRQNYQIAQQVINQR